MDCVFPGPYPRIYLSFLSHPYRRDIGDLEVPGTFRDHEYEHNSQPNTLNSAPKNKIIKCHTHFYVHILRYFRTL